MNLPDELRNAAAHLDSSDAGLMTAAAHQLDHQAAELDDLRATLARRDGLVGLARQHDAAAGIAADEPTGPWHDHPVVGCNKVHPVPPTIAQVYRAGVRNRVQEEES